MFTGLIESCGEVLINEALKQGHRLTVKAPFLNDLMMGESIAVNGVCLTLLSTESQRLAFDVSPETLKLTTLGTLKQGDRVHLERSMQATTRLGGHYVTGHVDTTARLLSRAQMGDYIEMVIGSFASPAGLYLLPKGSITIDGVSLTINEVLNDEIKLMLVPHTLKVTALGYSKVGQLMNVEFDYLTRIVAQQIRPIVESTIKTLSS